MAWIADSENGFVISKLVMLIVKLTALGKNLRFKKNPHFSYRAPRYRYI